MYVRSIILVIFMTLAGCDVDEPVQSAKTMCINALMAVEVLESCLSISTCAPDMDAWERQKLIKNKVTVYEYCPKELWPSQE